MLAVLCVAVFGGGGFDTSTNPTGGASAWTFTLQNVRTNILGISCPTTSLCVAVGSASVLTTTNPTGGASAWTVSSVDSPNSIVSISCPTSTLCVAGDTIGNIVVSTNPTGSATAWTTSEIVDSSLMNVGITYVGGPNRVTEYVAGATGNVTPLNTISGSNTGLNGVGGVALDGAGTLYVLNASTPSITEYASGATGNAVPIRTISGPSDGLTGPRGLAVDAAGTIYVVNSSPDSIVEFAPGASGNAVPFRTISGPNTGFLRPIGLARDNSGTLYVANLSDTSGNGLRGFITEYANGAAGNAAPVRTISGSNTGLGVVAGVAVDSAGTIYVAATAPDTSTAEVTEYPAGAFGNWPPIRTITDGLNSSAALAIDAAGTLYVGNVTTLSEYPTGQVAALRTISGLSGVAGIVVATVPKPAVTSVSPTSGPAAGGSVVTLTGTHLSGATSVRFGTMAAAGFTVNNDTQITATSPAGSGVVDITVGGPDGTSVTSAADRFTYIAHFCMIAGSTPATGSASSTSQYHLTGSDGSSWQEIDTANVDLTCSPLATQSALLTANADLFTGNAGFNQDIGIFVSDNGGGDQLLAWKESGGFAGTFSPNAAYVQTLFSMTSGHTYVFKLKWKTNKNAPGATIYAGAGSGPYSPTSLVAETFPTGVVPNFAVSTTQYTLANSDGTTWQPIDATNLITTLSPSVGATAVLGANADLFTGKTGYNQDFGIFVSDNGGIDTLVAWKESGGFAGTFSPNAAFAQTTYQMTSGHTYVFKLKWKTNKNAAGATIFAGAGSGPFSPTRLILELTN